MDRVRLLVFSMLLYASLLGGSFLFWQGPLEINRQKEDRSLTGQDNITLLFVGDIMLDRGVEFYAKEHQDWKWPFLKIADTLQKADLVFGNLESVISNKGTNQGSIYSFRAEPETIEGLSFAGIDVVSVANNHSLDYGVDAFTDSLHRLKQADIAPVGGGNTREEAHEARKTFINNTTIAILAYTSSGSPLWQAGIAFMDATRIPQLAEDIAKAKESADIVAVSFHFGKEYQKEPTKEQIFLSRAAIDQGADLVVGHHAHVVQPLERYNQGWIAYGLGNFVFDQGFSEQTMQGMLLEVIVKDKKIDEVIPRQTAINNAFQPQLLQNNF